MSASEWESFSFYTLATALSSFSSNCELLKVFLPLKVEVADVPVLGVQVCQSLLKGHG